MGIVRVRVGDRELSDKLVFKLITGGIGIFILLILLGSNTFVNWVGQSLIIWIGAMMIIIPLTFGFMEQTFTAKHLFMIIIGVVILVLFAIFSQIGPIIIVTGVVQSLVWMTIFSILLDRFKEKLQR
jgi:hypothetical protein